MMNIKKLLVIFAIAAVHEGGMAQTLVELPSPSKNGGTSVMEAFWNRHSDRDFSAEPLSAQDLGDMLFAASGVNRPEDGKITAPTAMNKQEIDLYVFTNDGAYKYLPQSHALQKVVEGDHRHLVAGTKGFSQDFVLKAPVSLVVVANTQKFGENPNDHAIMMAIADAGIMTENVCIYCAGRGLSTVPRATMDSEAISKLLKLQPESLPVLNLPVGYPAN